MINKNSIFLSLMALVLCVPSAEAQDISLGGLAEVSNQIIASNAQPMLRYSPRQASVIVGKLPRDYFRSTPAQSPELQAPVSHSMANMLVITGLATMLCIGMTIVGLCIMRRRPHSIPAKIFVSA